VIDLDCAVAKSIVIRSLKAAKVHRLLESVNDVAVNEFRSDVSTKVNGIYDVVDGHFVAIFLSESNIYVRVDAVCASLQRDDTRICYERSESRCVLLVESGGGARAEVTYEVPSDPLLTGQPFHYVGDADLDIGLTIYEISTDLGRQRQLMLIWR
jgi:hypothetical protein